MGMYAYVVYAKLSVYVYIHTHVYIVYAKLSVLLELTLKKKKRFLLFTSTFLSPPRAHCNASYRVGIQELCFEPGVVVCTCNPSTRVADTGVPRQYGPHNEPVSLEPVSNKTKQTHFILHR